jgi:hypothetical protein
MAGALLALSVGCGDRLVTVAGIVRLDDKPLRQAGVVLHPIAGGPVASATTDDEGRFQLEAANQSGLVPGGYRVAIIKIDMSEGMRPDKNGLATMKGASGMTEKWLIPKKYGRPETSELTVNVALGMESLNFNLKSR